MTGWDQVWDGIPVTPAGGRLGRGGQVLDAPLTPLPHSSRRHPKYSILINDRKAYYSNYRNVVVKWKLRCTSEPMHVWRRLSRYHGNTEGDMVTVP